MAGLMRMCAGFSREIIQITDIAHQFGGGGAGGWLQVVEGEEVGTALCDGGSGIDALLFARKTTNCCDRMRIHGTAEWHIGFRVSATAGRLGSRFSKCGGRNVEFGVKRRAER
jgi:hypothetical protein